jgi:hypothetical protein
MSTSLRPYYARTSPRHNYLADIRASAFEHQRLTKALKADLHCAEPQGRTSAQTHQPGLHCAGRALREGGARRETCGDARRRPDP